ncbi:MAG: succinate dehydrogenase cytochrome b subunit [Bdellovibrionaceae bacterium]|nr:succinate dehydrogenase cytochrome b subunit [Bdellovibrionales bacterium]MCB9253869.1 succinate dehydrogenase cytochrome b subunit [Pseudobdellovibrionaceae bacterium]
MASYFSSSIGRKHVLAFTGLGLCGFLVTHLAANLLIPFNPQAFNTYSYNLIHNPFIYLAETVLLLMFLVHIVLALWLNLENRAARPQRYHAKKKTGQGTTVASSTMVATGLITLVFLVLHLMNLKFGAEYTVTYDGVEMRDLHRLVLEYFSSLPNVVWYVMAHVALALHTFHGFQSAFQSLGFNHPRYTKCVKAIGKLYAVAIAGGFAFIAIWAYGQGGV